MFYALRMADEGGGRLRTKLREFRLLVRDLLVLMWDSLGGVEGVKEKAEFVRLLIREKMKLISTKLLTGFSPYLNRVMDNKAALVYLGLLVAFLGGRMMSRSAPRLQPLHMMSVVCGSYSGPEALALCRIEVPRIQREDEVLVRVMAAGLDRSDLQSVSGWGKVERGKQYGGFSIGRDFCGVVVEAGVAVSHLAPGDRVWGAQPFQLPGALSEQVVVRGCLAHRMPSNLNWEGAATVPYSALQVWGALVWRGGVKPDEAAGTSILVVDGVTDTGCLTVQLARMWGATVTVLCPSHTVPLARALGAHCVVSATEDEEVCINDLRDNGPFDLIVMAGDLVSQASLTSLVAKRGRFTSSLPPRLSSDGWGRLRRLFHPVWRGLVSAPHSPALSRLSEPLTHVTSAVEAGHLQPVLDTVISPREVPGCLARMATGSTVGKSVVLWDRL